MVSPLDTSTIPIIVTRVSTSEQKKGLKTQEEENERLVKQLGFKKTPILLTYQESGKKEDRQTVLQMRKILRDNPNKRYTIFYRDTPRFARMQLDGQLIRKEILDAGSTLFILDGNLNITGKKEDATANAFLQIGLMMAELAKTGEELASQTGTKKARKKGIFSGGIKQSWGEKVAKTGKRKGKNIHRLIYEDIPSNSNGITTNKGLARELKMTPLQARTIRKTLKEIEAKGGKAKIDEYLDFWDAVIEAEKTRGIGSRNKKPMTQRANALHRVTVAYIQDPFGWPDPNKVGNPDTALPTAPSEATGTIQDAVDNYLWYFKKGR
jgi:DNA invertase Pin-like site-specific DNA recombinase